MGFLHFLTQRVRLVASRSTLARVGKLSHRFIKFLSLFHRIGYPQLSMPTTSLTLLDRLRQPGHADAWDRFVRLYTPLLLHWAQRQGLHLADAEDLTQAVLVKVIRLLPSYERRNSQTFRGWLFTICRNECRDFRTRRATRPLPSAEGLDVAVAPPRADDPDEAEYSRRVVVRALELVRADFTPDVWAAFTGFAFDGRPAAEVAYALNTTANAVYQARYRVLRRLRDELGGLLD
jgi:RNA polymerase sigma-70 factor (ECF subfamily)